MPESAFPVTAADAALDFEAPYVLERLLKDRVVDTPAQAAELFMEIKRYLLLTAATPEATLGMHSARVDEAWHAFLLYTREYADFCTRFFGRYIGHAPTNAPRSSTGPHPDRPQLTFDGFRSRYQEFFGQPLPDVWYDELSVAPARRVINDAAGTLSAVMADDMAHLYDDAPEPLLSANAIVFAALDFVARTGAFYVRELPGELADDEKVALIQALVSIGTLRVAP